MACPCASKKQTRYQVTAADGKVLYSSTHKPTAETVAKRYPNSTVKEIPPGGKGAPATEKASAS
jgi:hypothetical protein